MNNVSRAGNLRVFPTGAEIQSNDDHNTRLSSAVRSPSGSICLIQYISYFIHTKKMKQKHTFAINDCLGAQPAWDGIFYPRGVGWNRIRKSRKSLAIFSE